jgi:hypothetical protein
MININTNDGPGAVVPPLSLNHTEVKVYEAYALLTTAGRRLFKHRGLDPEIAWDTWEEFETLACHQSLTKDFSAATARASLDWTLEVGKLPSPLDRREAILNLVGELVRFDFLEDPPYEQ